MDLWGTPILQIWTVLLSSKAWWRNQLQRSSLRRDSRSNHVSLCICYEWRDQNEPQQHFIWFFYFFSPLKKLWTAANVLADTSERLKIPRHTRFQIIYFSSNISRYCRKLLHRNIFGTVLQNADFFWQDATFLYQGSCQSGSFITAGPRCVCDTLSSRFYSLTVVPVEENKPLPQGVSHV